MERYYRLAIIIPYYQREKGILRRALASIKRQSCSYSYLTIVVDDQSPVPAISELSGFESMEITVITQKNQGVAAARNTGINYAIKLEIEYIAFLDSDDEWIPEHLETAIQSLENRADLYFADFFPKGSNVTRFERNRFDANLHTAISTTEFVYEGNLISDILAKNIIGTSTVVYRTSTANSLRFHTELSNAGEDHVFWMELAVLSKQTVFSTRTMALYGAGVNIYASGRWGGDQAIRQIYHDILFRKSITKYINIDNNERKIIQNHLNRLRGNFAQNIVHKIFNRKRMELFYCRKLLFLDPLSFIWFPYFVTRYIISVVFRRNKLS